MDTKVLIPTEENIAYAARLIEQGEVVGMPTETVYGLAASAFDEAAVEKIFLAKGRPQDNPLIVHIASLDMLSMVAANVPETAKRLAERFWPGPLTMIFEKSDRVPPAVYSKDRPSARRTFCQPVRRTEHYDGESRLQRHEGSNSGYFGRRRLYLWP